MSYTPTEWESTDVVTATRLNALEQAVGDLNMSYTPNVWQNGDILTADKMNALEQAVASGGGGSSDFSTAEITIVNNTTVAIDTWCAPVAIDGEEDYHSSDVFVHADDGTSMFTVILYKGVALAYFPAGGYTIAISGDIEDDGDDYYIITGNGTITIS